MKSVQSFLLFFLLFAVDGYPQDAFPSEGEMETTTSETSQSSLRPEGLTTLNLNGGEPTTEQLETNEPETGYPSEEKAVPTHIPEPILDQNSKKTSRNDSDSGSEMEQSPDASLKFLDPVPECKTNNAATASERDLASEATPRSESQTSETNNAATGTVKDRDSNAAQGAETTTAPESQISEDNIAAIISELDQAPEATPGSETTALLNPVPESEFSEANNATATDQASDSTSETRVQDPVSEISEVSNATPTDQAPDTTPESETSTLPDLVLETQTSEANNAATTLETPEAVPRTEAAALFNPVSESEFSEANNVDATNQGPDATTGSKIETFSQMDQASEAAVRSPTNTSPAPESQISEPNHIATESGKDQAPEAAPASKTPTSLDSVSEFQPSAPNNAAAVWETDNAPGRSSVPASQTSETNDVPTTSEKDQTRNMETPTSLGPAPESSTSKPIPAQTSSLPVETSSTLPNICTESGNFSDPTNCLVYITCTGNGTDLSHQENQCPERTAFSPVVRRCTRDISPCGAIAPICLTAGSIADPTNSSAYYWCVPSLLGGFHKFHVQCGTSEVYTDLIGLCWFEGPHMGPINYEPNDRDIVKADWKLLKKVIKTKTKEEKIRQKMEAKAKAHADKLAAKQRKKQKGAANVDNDVTIE